MPDVTRTSRVTVIYHDEVGGIARIDRTVVDRYDSPDGSTDPISQTRRIPIEPSDMTVGDKTAGEAWLARCDDMVERVRPLHLEGP